MTTTEEAREPGRLPPSYTDDFKVVPTEEQRTPSRYALVAPEHLVGPGRVPERIDLRRPLLDHDPGIGVAHLDRGRAAREQDDGNN
jgi:hypothetical protein